MGLITSLVIGGAMLASAGTAGAISSARGGSFWKGAALGLTPMGFTGGFVTKKENRGSFLNPAGVGSSAGQSLAGSDKARLLMTKGGQQGQDLQGGDFSTKRNIFGN